MHLAGLGLYRSGRRSPVARISRTRSRYWSSSCAPVEPIFAVFSGDWACKNGEVVGVGDVAGVEGDATRGGGATRDTR